MMWVKIIARSLGFDEAFGCGRAGPVLSLSLNFTSLSEGRLATLIPITYRRVHEMARTSSYVYICPLCNVALGYKN